jgi:magnesium-transporting ATPase (P-type)
MADSRIIKRNIRFWGKSGLQLTGIMLIFMVVYGFLFNMGSSRVFGDFWKTAYFYGGIISVLFTMTIPIIIPFIPKCICETETSCFL